MAGLPVQPEAADDIDENEELEPFRRRYRRAGAARRKLVDGMPDSPVGERFARCRRTSPSSASFGTSLYRHIACSLPDIVVLLRSVKNRNQIMEIFRQAGILPMDLGTGYFAAVEIRLMIALLQVLDNPSRISLWQRFYGHRGLVCLQRWLIRLPRELLLGTDGVSERAMG